MVIILLLVKCVTYVNIRTASQLSLFNPKILDFWKVGSLVWPIFSKGVRFGRAFMSQGGLEWF